MFDRSKPSSAKAGIASVATVEEPACAAEGRKRILVVDDDPVILRTTSIKLKSQGYAVMTAMDGSEAISMARNGKPDVILLDMNFPPDVAHGGGVGWDGFLIMSWLRRIEEAKEVPIVVITGSDSGKHRERALAEGASAFLNKPIDHAGLLKIIERVLASKSGAPVSPPPSEFEI